ncbi:MAG: hypothetical protein LBH84_02320 [Prevotellaceae bacterium]|nr:hypothetical protein [Prevotellaceae bacterium]
MKHIGLVNSAFYAFSSGEKAAFAPVFSAWRLASGSRSKGCAVGVRLLRRRLLVVRQF